MREEKPKKDILGDSVGGKPTEIPEGIMEAENRKDQGQWTCRLLNDLDLNLLRFKVDSQS